MSTFYYAEKVGNAYQLGLGNRDLGKIWFGVEGESASPLTQEDAERIALKIIDYLNKTYPVTDEMAGEYGDSEETVKRLKNYNEIAESVSLDDCDCDSDSRVDSLMKLMMLRAMIGD